MRGRSYNCVVECSVTCYQKCGYTLTCDCSVDAGGSTITVSGRVCFEDPVSGCKPKSGEAVEIYHAYWGATYVVYTDSQGYFRKSGLPRPPAGSTPIYVRWTDPDGVEHECTTSACFSSGTGGCPPGQKQCPDGSCVPLDGCCSDADCPNGSCVNGVCVPGTCTSNSDCPPGYHCDNGVCVPDTCTSDADCPPGYVCVNGTCVPSSDGLYYIDNVVWTLGTFCTSGFTVSGTLRDGSGAKAGGSVRVQVNGKTVGTFNVFGDFRIGVSKSQYADVLGCSNTIALTAISSSGVVGRSVSTTKDCPCNCSYSVSCTVSTTQVNDGGSVTFSGQLSSTSCGVANQQVKIYDNGSLVATATTDSQGRWSATLTLSGAGTHTLKAEAPNGSTCTKSVSVSGKRKIKVEVSYEDGLVRNRFIIWITEYGLQGFPSSQTIYYKEWTGATARVLVDRLEPYPPNDSRDTTLMEWLGSTGTISRKCSGYWGRERIPGCQYFQEACSHAWEVKKSGTTPDENIQKHIYDTLTNKPYGRPDFSDAQAKQIIAEVNRLVSEIVHAWINDGNSCDKCSSYPCSSSASVTGDWTGKKYDAFSDITV